MRSKIETLETKPYRYIIFFMLKDLPVGGQFQPSELHLTLLPWFALETEEKPFIDWFYRSFDGLKPFEAYVRQQKFFGPKKDVPVSILEPKSEFLRLHELALSWFGELGARWAEKDPYVGDDFVPHIAQRRGFVLEEGQQFHVTNLALVRAKRREDHLRTVAAKAVFHD